MTRVLAIPGDDQYRVRMVVIRDDEHLKHELDHAIMDGGGLSDEELNHMVEQLREDNRVDIYCSPDIIMFDDVYQFDGADTFTSVQKEGDET